MNSMLAMYIPQTEGSIQFFPSLADRQIRGSMDVCVDGNFTGQVHTLMGKVHRAEKIVN
jgi:hypothetical protein